MSNAQQLKAVADFHDYSHRSSKVFYCGASGMGKTTKAMHDLLEADYDFKFVFDHEGQFADRLPAFPSFTPEACLKAIVNGSVCFNPTDQFADVADGFEWFCKWVFNFSCRFPGTKLIVFDELQSYLPSNPGQWGTHPFAKICSMGRNRGIDVMALGPTLTELNPKFRGQLTEIFAFRHTDEQFARELIGKGIPLPTLAKLGPGDFIHWRNGQAEFEQGHIDLDKS